MYFKNDDESERGEENPDEYDDDLANVVILILRFFVGFAVFHYFIMIVLTFSVHLFLVYQYHNGSAQCIEGNLSDVGRDPERRLVYGFAVDDIKFYYGENSPTCYRGGYLLLSFPRLERMPKFAIWSLIYALFL